MLFFSRSLHPSIRLLARVSSATIAFCDYWPFSTFFAFVCHDRNLRLGFIDLEVKENGSGLAYLDLISIMLFVVKKVHICALILHINSQFSRKLMKASFFNEFLILWVWLYVSFRVRTEKKSKDRKTGTVVFYLLTHP